MQEDASRVENTRYHELSIHITFLQTEGCGAGGAGVNGNKGISSEVPVDVREDRRCTASLKDVKTRGDAMQRTPTADWSLKHLAHVRSSPLRLVCGRKDCDPGLPGTDDLGVADGSGGGSSFASRSDGFGGNSTGESLRHEACSNASTFDCSSTVRSLNGRMGSKASSSTQRSLNSTSGSLKEVKTPDGVMQRTSGSSLKHLAHVKSSGYGKQLSSGRDRPEADVVEQRRGGAGVAAAGNMNSAQSAGMRGSAEFAAAHSTRENKDSSGEREQGTSTSSSSREVFPRRSTKNELSQDVVCGPGDALLYKCVRNCDAKAGKARELLWERQEDWRAHRAEVTAATRADRDREGAADSGTVHTMSTVHLQGYAAFFPEVSHVVLYNIPWCIMEKLPIPVPTK